MYGDADRLRAVSRELKELTPVAEAWKAWRRAEADRAGAEEMLTDPELREMAREELSAAQAELERLREHLRCCCCPGGGGGGVGGGPGRRGGADCSPRTWCGGNLFFRAGAGAQSS